MLFIMNPQIFYSNLTLDLVTSLDVANPLLK